MLDILLAIGLSIPDSERLETSGAVQLAIAYDNWYVFGSYDRPELRNSGQDLNELDTTGYGIGYQFRLTERTFVRLAGGYFDVDTNWDDRIKDETVSWEMRRTFGEAPYHPTNFSYKIDGDWGAYVGVTHSVNKRMNVYFQYRFLKLDELYQQWDERIGRHDIDAGEPDCNCWWVKEGQLDMSAAQIGVEVKF